MIINDLLELRAYAHWCLRMLRFKRVGRGLAAGGVDTKGLDGSDPQAGSAG